MSQLIINDQLKPFDTVNIYTSFRTEAAHSFEGAAILIRKEEEGHSFIIQDEKLVTKPEDRVMINGKHIPLTKTQEDRNKQHQRLATFFDTVNKDIKNIKDLLRKIVSRDIFKLKILYNTIVKLRHKHVNSNTRVGTLFKEFDNQFIMLYFQQKYLKNWSPTIYRDEKWLVEFLPEQYCIDKKICLYNMSSNFRTYRRIRTIICISPSDDLESCDYRRYTTDDTGFSNQDRKKQRDFKKRMESELEAYESLLDTDGTLKQNIDIVYTNEELEMLDSLLLKKYKSLKRKTCITGNCEDDDNEEDEDDNSQHIHLLNDDSSFNDNF